MHSISRLVALATTISPAMAVYQGFNYGSTFNDGTPKQQGHFEDEFNTAHGLVGAPGAGFTSARLYTMIQAGTANAPISAIPAAINTKTSLLLGIWCSAGDDVFNNELIALTTAIKQYGTAFSDLVAGISVGSEDLYRISPTGILNKEYAGAQPLTIAHYIKRVRDTIAGTALAPAPVGHVDTWTAWVNSSNQVVIDTSDFIGLDAYPYFQKTQANSIVNNRALFNDAMGATRAAVGRKPVWVTETGFPVSGNTSGDAVPGVDNARTYWNEVGCPMFGVTNVWWYTFQDSAPATPNPSFGVIGSSLTTTPLFNLSCPPLLSFGPAGTGANGTASATKGSPSPTNPVLGGAGLVLASSSTILVVGLMFALTL